MSNKDKIRALLKGIETGDPRAVEVISAAQYIQHNPQTHEGREGLAALFARLARTNPRVNVVRAFEDGDFVFGHTEYDFATRRIGFEVFRFQDGLAVEHWDNIQPRMGPNASGRSMVDGPVAAEDPERTEENRALVRRFVEEVLIARRHDALPHYVGEPFHEHNPAGRDGREALAVRLSDPAFARYDRLHRVLAEGCFVLAVCEGEAEGRHVALYDLYRIAEGRIVEHWDTVEAIAPASEWKNDNGKF